jgi:hypothetical protein
MIYIESHDGWFNKIGYNEYNQIISEYLKGYILKNVYDEFQKVKIKSNEIGRYLTKSKSGLQQLTSQSRITVNDSQI